MKSDNQFGSGEVAGLPSFAASRMAVCGRHAYQTFLLAQQLISASALAMLVMANRRAWSAGDRASFVEMTRSPVL